MGSMSDLTARNALFARGAELGLNWTVGESADAASMIYLPSRDPLALRASLYPYAHNWMLRCTTPLLGTVTITVDKLNRDHNAVLRAVSVAIEKLVERLVDAEPVSALSLIAFLGALGIATENDQALAAATAGRRRAQAMIDSAD